MRRFLEDELLIFLSHAAENANDLLRPFPLAEFEAA
jgi:hypothetical protein